MDRRVSTFECLWRRFLPSHSMITREGKFLSRCPGSPRGRRIHYSKAVKSVKLRAKRFGFSSDFTSFQRSWTISLSFQPKLIASLIQAGSEGKESLECCRENLTSSLLIHTIWDLISLLLTGTRADRSVLEIKEDCSRPAAASSDLFNS
ncbi:hypothetical protein NC651_015566 [Populus alba x Populus x berolinensis]|nr:hypothetical protein NC651_015566 [Populus alba x Populus x berolinensis]